MMKVIAYCLFYLLLTGNSFGQNNTLEGTEKWLVQYHHALLDPLVRVSDSVNPAFFKDTLRHVLNKPESFSYLFSVLKSGPFEFTTFWILYSPDSNLRIFVWNDGQGGTWRSTEYLFQFKNKNGEVKVADIENEDPADETRWDIFYSSIDTLVITGKTYYLTIGTCAHGGVDVGLYDIIEVFEMQGDSIINIPFFNYGDELREFIKSERDPNYIAKDRTLVLYIYNPDWELEGLQDRYLTVKMKLIDGHFEVLD